MRHWLRGSLWSFLVCGRRRKTFPETDPRDFYTWAPVGAHLMCRYSHTAGRSMGFMRLYFCKPWSCVRRVVGVMSYDIPKESPNSIPIPSIFPPYPHVRRLNVPSPWQNAEKRIGSGSRAGNSPPSSSRRASRQWVGGPGWNIHRRCLGGCIRYSTPKHVRYDWDIGYPRYPRYPNEIFWKILPRIWRIWQLYAIIYDCSSSMLYWSRNNDNLVLSHWPFKWPSLQPFSR